MRLLTSPAWLAEDSAGSRRLVWHEHLPVGQLAVQVVVTAVGPWRCGAGLVAGVAAGLPDGEGRQAEAERGVGEAEEERLGAQPVAARRCSRWRAR